VRFLGSGRRLSLLNLSFENGLSVRNVFYWFGIFAGAIVIAAVIGFGYLACKGSSLDKESKSCANDAALAITSHWDAHALTSRASPNLAGSISAEQLSSMFDWFSVLGPLIENQDCAGGSSIAAFAGKPTSITARYTCNEKYQQGAATITLALVKIGNDWMINGFNVNSPVLLVHKPLQKS
jgi:hypothetical protein